MNTTPVARLFRLAAVGAACAACVGSSACDGNGSSSVTPPDPEGAARVLAVTATADAAANACTDIRPFYWEIGDEAGRIAGASVNVPGNPVTYDANSSMPIASATKWLYAAYVAERRGGALTAQDVQFLTFRSGFTNFGVQGCRSNDTVASCVARASNGVRTAVHVGKFFYNGGHMQKHASLPAPGMGLGALGNAALATEMRRLLGSAIKVNFSQPQLAGGARSSAADYAIFLRKLLGNQLEMSALLGSHAVCTNPATCATALSTPLAPGVDWHYSIGHWVEDDEVSGDGAFSSPGAFGFYPWIDAGRSHYGVIARFDVSGSGDKSAACGALIRKAWLGGATQ